MLSVWGRDLVALILYADLGFAIGLLARSPVTVLGGAIAVETIVRPVTMLIFEAPNPAMFLPFGLPRYQRNQSARSHQRRHSHQQRHRPLPAVIALAA